MTLQNYINVNYLASQQVTKKNKNKFRNDFGELFIFAVYSDK